NRKIVYAVEVGLLPSEKPYVERILRNLVQRARYRIVRELYPREPCVQNLLWKRLPRLPLYLPVKNGLRLLGILVYPVRYFQVGFEPRLHKVGMLLQKLRAHYYMRGYVLPVRPEVLLLEQNLAPAFQHEPGYPRLDRPRPVELLFYKQRELVGVRERDDLHSSTLLLELVAMLGKPGPERDVLRPADGRRRYLLAVKILVRLNAGVLPDDQRRSAARGAGNYMQSFTLRFYISVYGGVGPYVGY